MKLKKQCILLLLTVILSLSNIIVVQANELSISLPSSSRVVSLPQPLGANEHHSFAIGKIFGQNSNNRLILTEVGDNIIPAITVSGNGRFTMQVDLSVSHPQVWTDYSWTHKGYYYNCNFHNTVLIMYKNNKSLCQI